MIGMDVFNSSAFTATQLTGAVNRIPYAPQLLGSLSIYEPAPSRTRDIYVERYNNTLTLIPVSEIGEAPHSRLKDKRDARSFRTVRLAEQFTITAEEVQGVRAFGSETEMKQIQTEYAKKMGKLVIDMELTKEHHRLAGVQGLLLDADGTTVLYDWFDEFDVARPPVYEFDFAKDSLDVRRAVKQIVRDIKRAAKGALPPNAKIHAVCGDDFYDNITQHPAIERYYLNWAGAKDLKGKTGAFEAFEIEDVVFHNYRGTDDNSTVAVGEDECKFFPVGGEEVFKVAYAPAEFGPYVNTLGLPMYALNVPDLRRQAYTTGELYSYPLYMCQRPEVLRAGIATSNRFDAPVV